jgi:hypothetical protein
VPGPQQPLYLLGRRIREIYPYVPLSPQNHAVSFGLISYDGGVFFGLAGDRDVLPDLDRLAAAIDEAIREQPVPRRRPKSKQKAAAKAKSTPKAKAKARPNRRAKAKPRAKQGRLRRGAAGESAEESPRRRLLRGRRGRRPRRG